MIQALKFWRRHISHRVRAEGADPDGRIAPRHFQAWRARQDVFTDMASYQFDFGVELRLGDHAELVDAVDVTTSMFDVLGVVPARSARRRR